MSYTAEKAVIGALLLDGNSIKDIYDELKPEMFTSELLKRTYREFQRGYDNHYDVTLATLEQRIAGDDFPSNVVLSDLSEIMLETATSATIRAEADVIIADYKTRAFERIINHVKPNSAEVADQIRAMQQELELLCGSRKNKSQTLAEIAEEHKSKYFCDKEEVPLYLGFEQLDDTLGGLEGGDVIVIGARPAVGKSAFVTQIATTLAKSGKRVGYYNLEMQTKQVYERFVVAESGIGLTRLRKAVRFLGDEKERFDRANEVLSKANNIVITTGSKTISEIRNESRNMDYDVIIIDYLQLLKPDSNYKGNRYAEVGAISKAIKALAMELNIPIIELSQLNRVSQLRDDKEPTMSELREAGDIEQDASVILLLWNLDENNNAKKGLKIEKNRQGMLKKIVLNFNGDMMRFEETNEDVATAKKFKTVADDDNPFI